MPAGGLITGGIISGLGSLFGGIFGSSAATKAAQEQLQGQEAAVSQLQQTENQALNYQTNATGQAVGGLSPYLSGGAQAESNLSSLLGTPGQGLLTPWNQTFTAPTAAQAAATPGYQFQLQQGENALQGSAAAQGGLLSGNTLAGINQYAQGLASSNYQNVFNNSLTQYNSAYQTFLNNQASTYGMLSGQAGQGLTAANSAGNLLQSGAQNYGAITTNTGADIASLLGQEGATKAAGTLGSANALTQAFGGTASSIGQGIQLGSLANLGGGTSAQQLYNLYQTLPQVGSLNPTSSPINGSLIPPPQ